MHIYINIGTSNQDIDTDEIKAKRKKLTPEQKEKIKEALKKAYSKAKIASGRIYSAVEDKVFDGKCFLSELFDEIAEDVAAVRERDPAARSDVEVMLLYSGVHAMLAYRVAHKLYVNKKFLPARAVSQLARFLTGIEIHPGATIGKRLMIDHGSGVVIGETCIIGDDCTLYQGVTLGGTGKDTGKRHPTLGNNVMVGAGAKVLGPFRIGDGAKIAAGAVVLKEVPAGATAVGIPAKVVRQDGERVEEQLDQIHIPDPISQQLSELEAKIAELKLELDELKQVKSEE